MTPKQYDLLFRAQRHLEHFANELSAPNFTDRYGDGPILRKLANEIAEELDKEDQRRENEQVG